MRHPANSNSSSILGLAALAACLAGGCANQQEFEMTNAALARSRCVFLAKDQFLIFEPPLFASAWELQAHRNGEDAYERRFKARFPARQEDWLAQFRPIGELPDVLRREAALAAPAAQTAAAVESERPPGAQGNETSAAPQGVFYLMPFEDTEPETMRAAEAAVRTVGGMAITNEKNQPWKWPMPPGGSALKQTLRVSGGQR